MIRRIGYLIMILAVSFSMIGCTGKKAKDLTQREREFYQSLTQIAVYEKVNSLYGIEPVTTVDDITAYESEPEENQVYARTEFTSTGSYTVKDGSGVTYSGTFKVTGHSVGHGDGWDSCEITPPTNGDMTLPELSPDRPAVTTAGTSAEETNLYEPLSRYIHENVTLMGTFAEPAVECDINKDGHPELCTTVTTGSGMVTTLVVVYDVHNDQGYMLNERGKYDYRIMGSSDDVISVEKREFGGDQKTYGTLSIENSELVFCER